jgi:hypothetical protein
MLITFSGQRETGKTIANTAKSEYSALKEKQS